MEKDDEIKGEGNSYTTMFRQYDPRLNRWLTTDPVTHHYSSPYVAFSNSMLTNTDPDGNCDTCPDPKDAKTHTDDNGVTYDFDDGLWKIRDFDVTQEEMMQIFEDIASTIPDIIKDMSDQLDESGNQVSFSIKFRSNMFMSANTSGKVALTYSEGEGLKIFGFTVAGIASKTSIAYDFKKKELSFSETGEVDFLGLNYRNTTSISDKGNHKVLQSDLDIAVKWKAAAIGITYRLDLNKVSPPSNQNAGGYGIAHQHQKTAIGNINRINLGNTTGPFAVNTIPRTRRHTTEYHFENPFSGFWGNMRSVMPTSQGGWFRPN
ncbi:MAG: RHS repeat-associated protein [Polaribacter sp.]|jgi:RHS repeat-associated protein